MQQYSRVDDHHAQLRLGMLDAEEHALEARCPSCKAGPDMVCCDRSGRPRKRPHAARVRTMYQRMKRRARVEA